MRPTIQLINALRKAADRIAADPEQYKWTNGSTCNCGFLAGGLGLDASLFHGIWSRAAQNVETCEASGLPVAAVVRGMLSAGLSPDDIFDIENLTDDGVRVRAGLVGIFTYDDIFGAPTASDRSEPDAVIRYFRAQADILEEQLGEQFESRPLNLSEIPNSSATPPLTQPGPGREVVR